MSPTQILMKFHLCCFKITQKICFPSMTNSEWTEPVCYGALLHLSQLKCRVWQTSTAAELELPDSETFLIRALLHTILPWGRLPECTGRAEQGTGISLLQHNPRRTQSGHWDKLGQCLSGERVRKQSRAQEERPPGSAGVCHCPTCLSHTRAALSVSWAALSLSSRMKAVYSRICS